MSAKIFTQYWKRLSSKTVEIVEKDWKYWVCSLGGLFLFTSNVGYIKICVGSSMTPTIHPKGELLFVERLSTKWFNRYYAVNDVVICTSMNDPDQTVCKRIRGVEGGIMIYRNMTGETMKIKIPTGHVFLLGDNLEVSNDSRNYGCVPVGMLQGRVIYKMGLRPKLHFLKVDTPIPVLKETAYIQELNKEKLPESAVSKPVQTKQPVELLGQEEQPVKLIAPAEPPVKESSGDIEK